MTSADTCNVMTPFATIRAHVLRILREQIDVDAKDAGDGAHLVDDLGSDELGRIEVLLAIEETFEVEISDEVAERLVTVGDIVSYLDGLGLVVANGSSSAPPRAHGRSLHADCEEGSEEC